MNFDKDTRKGGAPSLTGEVLAEAMPWIKNTTGKTVVIKYGGAAMVDEKLRADVMSDILLLKIIGVNPVIVHGGGKAITDAMMRVGLPFEFVNGQRVTSDEAMDLVRIVLAGKVNQELVDAMNAHGKLAVGICGGDAGTIIAKQADPALGRVGTVVRINTALINDLVQADYIPVIASVGVGAEPGEGFFNVNADLVAGHVAAAIGAHKVVFLTDVDGLYVDFSDKSSLVSNMTLPEAKQLLEDGAVSSGMIPKLSSCVRALEAGVHRAHILNGTMPHALLLELLTTKGIGTMVDQPDEIESFEAKPLGNFAAKLVENRKIDGEV